MGYKMLSFCGQDKCSIDANGRIKFSPRFLSDFSEQCSGEVVLHCLPEGALAVYPEEVYLQMRRHEPRPAERAATSLVFRRTLRHFGASSQSEKISAQGRITLPSMYRDAASLKPGSEALVVGVEIGVEIWNPDRWLEELNKVNEHIREKGEREMAADLMNTDSERE
jgi:DNA-binding transcriptional regulator/RsmH inhibitor MraZ